MKFSALFSQRLRTKFGNYEIVTPGLVSSKLKVSNGISTPIETKSFSLLKSIEEKNGIRESCKTARKVLEFAKKWVKVGVATDEIDKAVHNYCQQLGVYPSPLDFDGFPKSICTSVNNVVCHGIPDDRPLRNGDILSIDVTVYKNGFHGDCAETVLVGNVDEQGQALVKAAKECLAAGIAICSNGTPFTDIGTAIEAMAKHHGFNVVPCVTGHGIGRNFHEPPDIYHFEGSPQSEKMQKDMVFTIEPAITQGDVEMELLEDGWTVVTADNARSAQFEHTILIVETGAEILTVE